MNCKHKIGNLHTSYKKMGDGFHLKAFFGININCAMGEVLKFPNLFKIEDLNFYLDQIIVIPKIKNILFTKEGSFLSPAYIAEEKFIIPSTINVLNSNNGIVYLTFEQHFNRFVTRKYKTQVSVKDYSITRAIEIRDKMIEFNKMITNLRSDNEITGKITTESKELSNLAVLINPKRQEVYNEIISEPFITIEMLSRLSTTIKEEIKFINDRLNINNNYATGVMSEKNTIAASHNIILFDKEFKQEISFNFNDYIRKESLVLDGVSYSKISSEMTQVVENLPNFDVSYSKKHSYEDKQTLEKKAPNYNVSFVNKANIKTKKIKKEFIVDKFLEEIHVLVGHNNNNVTAEIFTPLSIIKNDLVLGSSYLCKTNMVESEEQYFILEK
jgi:hypothetical protein